MLEINLAFSLGLLSSLHCIGMCGPISLALPIGKLSYFGKSISLLIYNLGRILTYSTLGLLIALFGKYLSPSYLQQDISKFLGIAVIIASILFIIKPKLLVQDNYFFKVVKRELTKLFQRRSYPVYLLIGMLNGLLPCAMVYMAIGTAITLESKFSSILFMCVFGLGTMPAMLLIGFGGGVWLNQFKSKISRVVPFIAIAYGFMLILRGMDLGIPYISPKLNHQNMDSLNCAPSTIKTSNLK